MALTPEQQSEILRWWCESDAKYNEAVKKGCGESARSEVIRQRGAKFILNTLGIEIRGVTHK